MNYPDPAYRTLPGGGLYKRALEKQGNNGGGGGGVDGAYMIYFDAPKMLSDTSQPVGTIGRIDNTTRYKGCSSITSTDVSVYGMCIRRAASITSGTILRDSGGNAIYFEQRNGQYFIVPSVDTSKAQAIPQSGVYKVDGYIKDLISDGSYKYVPTYLAPTAVTVKVLANNTPKYYIFNGQGWNRIKDEGQKNGDPLTYRIAHRCIRYNSHSGILYTGRFRDLRTISAQSPLWHPAIMFGTKNDDRRTFDLSKLGTEYFFQDDLTSAYYEVDTEAKTITFEDNVLRVAFLKFPDYKTVSNATNSSYIRKQFGYYIDSSGHLEVTSVDSLHRKVQAINPPLPPITSSKEVLENIHPGLDSGTFKYTPNTHRSQTSNNLLHLNIYGGVDIQMLRTGRQTKTKKAKYRNMPGHTWGAKWQRIKVPRKFYKRIKTTDHTHFWDTLRFPAGSVINGTSLSQRDCKSAGCAIIRVRRTNRHRTRFSDWTYWRLYISFAYVNSQLNILKKSVIRLKDVYYIVKKV